MGIVQQQLFYIERGETRKHRNRKIHNQYFTPEFTVEKALALISKIKVKNIIDPAAGEGVFLKSALNRWKSAELFGIDIDEKVVCELNESHIPNACFVWGDSLLQKTWQIPKIQRILSSRGFDLVVGNPPFSSWFNRITSKDILSNYELGRNSGKLKTSQAIEVLFLEIFVRLTKNKGFIAIVLPDSILSNPQYRYVREFILKNTKVQYIINLPRNVFEETSAKTSILVLEKRVGNALNYFTEIHDLEKTGKVNNAIKVFAENLFKRMDYSYFYNLQKSPLQELINIGVKFNLLRDFAVYCKTGKTLYGAERKFSDNGLRFLHATNITDIGINYKRDERFIDPSSNMNFPGAFAKVGDILFVRVGVGCAGRIAIVANEAEEGIATDYIHIFRVENICPYFLIVYLKTKYGKHSINLLRHGVGTVSINKTDLLSIPIPIISESIQAEVKKRYKKILFEYRITPENNLIDTKMRDLISFTEQSIQKMYSYQKYHNIRETAYVGM